MIITIIAVLISIVIFTILVLLCTKIKFSIQTKSLKGKHVVITGGSSGIGKSVGVLAAKLGAHVTILARDVDNLKVAQEEIIKNCTDPVSQKIKAISLDVTNPQNVDETLKKIDADSPVFMLVNCAGKAIWGTIEDTSIPDIQKLIDLNFMGTVYCIKTLVPLMKQRRKGIIVITSSQLGLMSIFGLASYSATKFALRGLAEGIHMELRPYNISVTLSLPPATDTPGLERENKDKPVETVTITDSTKLFGPDDVAQKLLEDAMNGKFYSYIGFESFSMSTLCCGMSPFVTFGEVLLQSFFMGPIRLITTYYILKFQKIVQKCKNDRENKDKI